MWYTERDRKIMLLPHFSTIYYVFYTGGVISATLCESMEKKLFFGTYSTNDKKMFIEFPKNFLQKS